MMRRLSVLAAALVLASAAAFVPPLPTQQQQQQHPSRRITTVATPTPILGSTLGSSTSTRRAAALDPEAVSTAVTVAASGAAAASPFVAKIVNNLSSVAVLAVIISVHELGHFLAAIGQGIRVKNFSIGFGPTLLSIKPGDPEDEDAIEYTVRAIPAGGFVSFPQHYEVDDDGEIIRCVRACVRACEAPSLLSFLGRG